MFCGHKTPFRLTRALRLEGGKTPKYFAKITRNPVNIEKKESRHG